MKQAREHHKIKQIFTKINFIHSLFYCTSYTQPHNHKTTSKISRMKVFTNKNYFTMSSSVVVPFVLMVMLSLSSSGVNGCETIYDIVCGSNELKGFCQVLDTLGLNSTLGDDGDPTSSATMMTVFAPTTDALFDAVDIANTDKDDLYEIFSFHVSVEKQRAMYAKDLNCNAGANLLQMTNGKNTRTLCVKGTPTYQKGQGNIDGERLPMFVKADIEACNGVVHIIDHVLLSKGSEPTFVPEEETDVAETGYAIILSNSNDRKIFP